MVGEIFVGQSYRELVVWQKAMELVSGVYKITTDFPKHEVYGLMSQMRRAAVSIPSNIAEGQARHSQKEFMHFLAIARGSLAELETQFFVAHDLGYTAGIRDTEFLELTSHVGCLLNNLCSAIERRTENGQRRTPLP